MCALCKNKKWFCLQITLQTLGVICICNAAALCVTLTSCFIHHTEASAAVFAGYLCHHHICQAFGDVQALR
jgi:hypothetical protein